ncbi:right-handed parallel beta-helix repeat-containing protein [Shimia sp.]|uniref:right-handed parallel beta-helix repeat-containing protein n=1 Tax=Shimia sp. TaxID=1954381 RepID=UPI003BA9CE5D
MSGAALANQIADFSHLERAYADVFEKYRAKQLSGSFDVSAALLGGKSRDLTVSQPSHESTGEPASVIFANTRLVLGQLSLSAGSNNQLSIVQAQSDQEQRSLTIQGGQLRFSELVSIVRAMEQQADLIGVDGFKVPIAIWADAELVLEPNDHLRLSRSDGAFVANFGRLTVFESQISGSGSANLREPDYRPFVATAGTGIAYVKNSHLESLGFGTTAAFSGVSLLSPGLYQPSESSVIQGNTFLNSGPVSVKGARGADVSGNLFLESIGPGMVVRGGEGAQVVGNTFVAPTGGSAIRVTDGASGTYVANNLILASSAQGIEVEGAGAQTQLLGNHIWNSARNGISVSRSDCTYVDGNYIFSAQSRGISLSSSRGSVIKNNRIFRNQSAGIHVTNQPVGTKTRLMGNQITANRVGLSSASAADLLMQDNDFSEQFPRLLEGDLIFQSRQILQDLHGKQFVTLASAGVDQFALPELACRNTQAQEG